MLKTTLLKYFRQKYGQLEQEGVGGTPLPDCHVGAPHTAPVRQAEGRGGALCAIPNLIIPGAENILRLIDGLIKLKFSRKGTNYSLQYKTDFAQHWHVTRFIRFKKINVGLKFACF